MLFKLIHIRYDQIKKKVKLYSNNKNKYDVTKLNKNYINTYIRTHVFVYIKSVYELRRVISISMHYHPMFILLLVTLIKTNYCRSFLYNVIRTYF